MKPTIQLVIAVILVVAAIVVAVLALQVPAAPAVDARSAPRFAAPAASGAGLAANGGSRLSDIDPFTLQQGVRRSLTGVPEPPPPPLDLPAPPILPLGANSP